MLETIVPLGRILHGASAASSAASQGFAAASSFLWSGWGVVSERVTHSVEATLEVAKTTGRTLAEQVCPVLPWCVCAGVGGPGQWGMHGLDCVYGSGVFAHAPPPPFVAARASRQRLP